MDTNVSIPDLSTYINVVGDSILLFEVNNIYNNTSFIQLKFKLMDKIISLSTAIIAYICKLKMYLLIYNTFITKYLIFITQVIVQCVYSWKHNLYATIVYTSLQNNMYIFITINLVVYKYCLPLYCCKTSNQIAMNKTK